MDLIENLKNGFNILDNDLNNILQNKNINNLINEILEWIYDFNLKYEENHFLICILNFILKNDNNLINDNLFFDWINSCIEQSNMNNTNILISFIKNYVELTNNHNNLKEFLFKKLNDYLNSNNDKYLNKNNMLFFEILNITENIEVLNQILNKIYLSKKFELLNGLKNISFYVKNINDENINNYYEFIFTNKKESKIMLEFMINYKYEFFKNCNTQIFKILINYAIEEKDYYKKILIFELIYEFLLIDEELYISKQNQNFIFLPILKELIIYIFSLQDSIDNSNFNEISNFIIKFYYRNYNINEIIWLNQNDDVNNNFFIKINYLSFSNNYINLNIYDNWKYIWENIRNININNEYFDKILKKISKKFPSLILDNKEIIQYLCENSEYDLTLKIIFNLLDKIKVNSNYDIFLKFILKNLNRFNSKEIYSLNKILKMNNFGNIFYNELLNILKNYNNNDFNLITPIFRMFIKKKLITENFILEFKDWVINNKNLKDLEIILLIYEIYDTLKYDNEILNLLNYVINYFKSDNYNYNDLIVYIKLFIKIFNKYNNHIDINFNFNEFIFFLINNDIFTIDEKIKFFEIKLKYDIKIIDSNIVNDNFSKTFEMIEFFIKYINIDKIKDNYFINNTFYEIYNLIFEFFSKLKVKFYNIYEENLEYMKNVYIKILNIFSYNEERSYVLKINYFQNFLNIFIDCNIIFDNQLNIDFIINKIKYSYEYLKQYDDNLECLKFFKYLKLN